MTLSQEQLHKLRTLIAQRHDGQLTSEEGAWLKTILATNPEARQVFVRYNAMYALLTLEAAAFSPDGMREQTAAALSSVVAPLSLDATHDSVVPQLALGLGFVSGRHPRHDWIFLKGSAVRLSRCYVVDRLVVAWPAADACLRNASGSDRRFAEGFLFRCANARN